MQEQIQTINERTARLERLDTELDYHAKQWCYYPVVKAIQAMRGIKLLTAVGLITELGDLSRFDNPQKLMSYVGKCADYNPILPGTQFDRFKGADINPRS